MSWNPLLPGSTVQQDPDHAIPAGTGNVEFGLPAGKGFVFTSPNGTRYSLTVSNAGAAVWTAL